jgi:hypothetical protein
VRAVVEPTATLTAALEALLASRVGVVPVVDGAGALLGVVDLPMVMAATETMHGHDAPPADGRTTGRGVRDDEPAVR